MDKEILKKYLEILELDVDANWDEELDLSLSLSDIKESYQRLKALYTSETMSLATEPIEDEFSQEEQEEILNQLEEAYNALLHYMVEKDRAEKEAFKKAGIIEDTVAEFIPGENRENIEEEGAVSEDMEVLELPEVEELLESQELIQLPEVPEISELPETEMGQETPEAMAEPEEVEEPLEVKEAEVPETMEEPEELEEPQEVEEVETPEAMAEPEEVEEPQEVEEVETPEAMAEPEEVEEPQEVKEAETPEAMAEPEEVEEPQEVKEAEVPETMAEPEELEEPQEVEEAEATETMEEPEELEEPQEVEEVETPEAMAEPEEVEEPQEVKEAEAMEAEGVEGISAAPGETGEFEESKEAGEEEELEESEIMQGLTPTEEELQDIGLKEPELDKTIFEDSDKFEDIKAEASPSDPSDLLKQAKPIKGRSFRKTREKLEIGIHEMAVSTGISYKVLVNIEKEQYQKLPEPGYLRWLITTYAKALSLDPKKAADDYMARYRKWQRNQEE